MDLYTPKGAAGSCHGIFRGFQKMNSISHRVVAPASSHGHLLNHRSLLSYWVRRSTWTQFSILPRDWHRKHYVRILSLSLVIRPHDFRVLGLSSPVQSVWIGTLSICVPVTDDAQVFPKRRLVEARKQRHAVRRPWAQRRSSRA